MRPVHGFDRPALQWIFVVLAIVLVGVAVSQALALRRARTALEQARTAEADIRLELQQAKLEFARERRARETMTDEATRLRAEASGGLSIPSLTLSPLVSRGATPPAASVEQPAREQIIELRLLLPPASPKGAGTFSLVLRRWTDGRTIASRAALQEGQAGGDRVVSALITGDLLREGSYEVLLTRDAPGANGSSSVASYEVTIAGPAR